MVSRSASRPSITSRSSSAARLGIPAFAPAAAHQRRTWRAASSSSSSSFSRSTGTPRNVASSSRWSALSRPAEVAHRSRLGKAASDQDPRQRLHRMLSLSIHSCARPRGRQPVADLGDRDPLLGRDVALRVEGGQHGELLDEPGLQDGRDPLPQLRPGLGRRAHALTCSTAARSASVSWTGRSVWSGEGNQCSRNRSSFWVVDHPALARRHALQPGLHLLARHAHGVVSRTRSPAIRGRAWSALRPASTSRRFTWLS